MEKGLDTLIYFMNGKAYKNKVLEQSFISVTISQQYIYIRYAGWFVIELIHFVTTVAICNKMSHFAIKHLTHFVVNLYRIL